MFVKVRLLGSYTIYLNTDYIVAVVPDRSRVTMSNGEEHILTVESIRELKRELGNEVD